MATGPFIIHMGDDGWQIAALTSGRPWFKSVNMPQDATPDQVSQQLADALAQNGYSGQGVALALRSDLCLCATIDTDGLPRKNARQAMIYRLEEKLPIAAEETVADFVTVNGKALGVCVQTEKLAPVVEALEQRQVHIEIISPTAILAMQHKLTSATGNENDIFLWHHDRNLDLFALAGAKPISWRLLTQYNDDDLAMHLGIQATGATAPLRVAASGVESTTLNRIAQMPEVQTSGSDHQSMSTAATLAANQIVTGKQTAWINLRRGGVGGTDRLKHVHTPLVSIVAAGLLFLACLTGAMWWRTRHYQQLATGYDKQQEVVYSQLYPDRPIPLNIKSRLASEQRRLAGLRGNDAQLPKQTTVLLVLRDALSCLPEQIRYRILEVQLDQNGLYLEGQARSHSDAEAIAAALNKLRIFNVAPPRTEKLSGKGIAFTIRAATVADASASGKEGMGRTL